MSQDRFFLFDEHEGNEKHRYCSESDLVEGEGVWKGKKLGYFFNILGILRRNSLTHAQVRLINKKLRSDPLFTDVPGTSLYFQIKRFIEIVAEYSSLKRKEVIDAIKAESPQ